MRAFGICLAAFAILSILSAEINAYRILGVFPVGARSHYIVGSSLMKGLAGKGHEVTLIAAFGEKSPPKNYRSIVMDDVLEYTKTQQDDLVNHSEKSMLETITDFYDMGIEITRLTLGNKNVQKLLNAPNEKFDVVICEVFLTEALFGLAEHFQAHLIGMSTFGAGMWTTDLVGSPSPLSYVPNPLLTFGDRMTLGQRIANTLMAHNERLFQDNYNLVKQSALYKQFFPNAKLSLDAVRRNVSLVLLNNHVSLTFPRPYMPNMIEVGGIQLSRKTNPLPKEMQDFLDSAKDGAIYFSMGSNLKSSLLPKEKLDVLLKTFSSLKQKVLWKWEVPDLPGKSDNVFISPWFPQDDILAHPNVKVFITHGGLLSITEAVYHGVPFIGIPMFGDQFLNMAKAQAGGYGLTMLYDELSVDKFSSRIQELLSNPKYGDTAKELSRRYRDQPMTPMETAVFWVEYVVRHNGAHHLHCAGQDLNFVEYHNLDVFAIIYGTLFLVLYLLYKIMKFLVCCACCRGKNSVDKEKKNK